jgi:hypothetical protein
VPKLTSTQVQNRISIAKRQANDRYDEWEESLRMVLNRWDIRVDTNEPRLAPNIVYSTYRRLLASLNYNDPEFYTLAMDRDALDYEDAVSGTLQYYWKTLNVPDQSRLAIADAILYPYGVLQLGMSRAYQTEKEVFKAEESDTDALEENIELFQGSPVFVREGDDHEIHIQRHTELRQSDEILSMPQEQMDAILDAIDEHIEEHSNFVIGEGDNYSQWEPDSQQKPFIRRRRPHDFFWEPGTSLLDESGYVMLRTWPRVADVMSNPRLKNKDHIQATQIDPHLADLFDSNEMDMSDDDVGRVALWDVYDIRNKTWETWSEGSDKPHFVYEDAATGSHWPYRHMEGYPFVVIALNTIPDRIAGPAVSEYLKHPQDLAMQLYENIATHSLRANAKYEVLLKNIDGNQDAAISALENSDQQAVIPVKEMNSVKPIQPSQLDPAIFGALNLNQQTVQENSGLVDSARGQVTGASATETSQAASSTNILLGDNLGTVIMRYTQLSEKLLGALKQYGPEMFALRDLRYQERWIEYKRENLLYEFQIKVEIPAPGDETKLQVAWINLHHELQNSPNVQGEGMREIQRQMVKSYGIEPDRVIRGPGVSSEMMVTYEHALMQQGQALEPVPGEDYSYHIEQHTQVLSQLQTQMQQVAMQVVSQAAQQNPQIAQDANIQQQILSQNPQVQQVQGFLGILTQHLDATKELAPSGGTGRPRSAVSIPEGNPGRVDSILSAQGNAG